MRNRTGEGRNREVSLCGGKAVGKPEGFPKRREATSDIPLPRRGPLGTSYKKIRVNRIFYFLLLINLLTY